MKFNLGKIVKTLIPIILVGIIGNTIFAVYKSEEGFLDTLSQFSLPYFLLAGAMSLLPWLGHALRTVIWSNFLNAPVSFKNSFRIALAHDLGGAITPTVVGGTPIKLGLLIANKVPAPSASMIVLLQVLEDLVFLLSSLPLSIYFAGGLDNPAVTRLNEVAMGIAHHLWWITPGLVFTIFLIRLIYKKRSARKHKETPGTTKTGWKQQLRQGWNEFATAGQLVLKRGKWRFLLTALMMYIEWSCRFAIPIVLALALGIKADPFQLFFLHWIVWFTMLIVPTPGATGGAEATFYFLFLPFIPEALIGVLITGWRFTSYYFMMMIGAVILQIIGVIDD